MVLDNNYGNDYDDDQNEDEDGGKVNNEAIIRDVRSSLVSGSRTQTMMSADLTQTALATSRYIQLQLPVCSSVCLFFF